MFAWADFCSWKFFEASRKSRIGPASSCRGYEGKMILLLIYIYYLYIGCIISTRTLTLYINTSFVDCSTPLWYSIHSDLEMYKRVCVFYFSSQISKYVLIRFLSSLLDHNRQNTTHRCLNTRIPCRCSCASRSLGSQFQ